MRVTVQATNPHEIEVTIVATMTLAEAHGMIHDLKPKSAGESHHPTGSSYQFREQLEDAYRKASAAFEGKLAEKK